MWQYILALTLGYKWGEAVTRRKAAEELFAPEELPATLEERIEAMGATRSTRARALRTRARRRR